MSVILTKNYQLKILQYLYGLSDRSSFYEIPNNILNLISQKEKFEQLKQLENLELVLFQREITYSTPPVIFFDFSNPALSTQFDAPENNQPIYGKITEIGINAVDKYNDSQK